MLCLAFLRISLAYLLVQKMRFLTKSLGRIITITGGTLHRTEISVDTSKLSQMTLFENSNGYPAQLLLKFHSCCMAETTRRDENELRIYHESHEDLRELRHKIQLASQATKKD